MMDSASALPAAPTAGGAYRPVAPKPLRAGRFGMVRTMGMWAPNQRDSAACGMPAATEMSKGLAISTVAFSARHTGRICCGFTARITASAPVAALALSGARRTP